MEIYVIDREKRHPTCPYNGNECHVCYCKFKEDFAICGTYNRLLAKEEKTVFIPADEKTAKLFEQILEEGIKKIEIVDGETGKIRKLKDLNTLN